MNKLVLISMVICMTFAIQQRTQHIQYEHFLDGELCKKQGGYVCGFVNKDCCLKGCDSKMFGMNEYCIDGQLIDLSKIPDCTEVCSKSNGTLFKKDLISDYECCKTTALKDNKCPLNSLIDISACGKGNFAGQFVDFMSHKLSQ